MTDKEKKSMAWYELVHSNTGTPIKVLQQRQSRAAALGGHARLGKTLSEEHRRKIGEGKKRSAAEKRANSQDSPQE